MQLLVRSLGQRPRLELWERRAFARDIEGGPRDGDNRDCFERVIAREAAGPPQTGGPSSVAAKAILAYEVFPAWLLTPVLRRAPVEVGDTVGALYHLAPGLELFFASRVVDRFDRSDGPLWRNGFTYRTLDGHPELGEETFCVEKNLQTGEIAVALRSWSRPGMLLTRLGYPLARRWQRRANEAALDNLQQTVRAGSIGI